MRVDFLKIKENEKIDYIGDLNLFNNHKGLKTIKEFKSIKGEINLQKADSIIIVKYDIYADLIVYSSLTSNPFEYPIHVNETLYYTDHEEMDSEDVFYVEDNYIDLDQEVYSLIITSIPLILHKEDEEYPEGENYRVLKEEDVDKDDGSHYSPFDKLKDLTFDD